MASYIRHILLTMLKLRHVSRLHIQDTQGELRPQNPTAFADDLLTYDPDQEDVELHADVISFFCMMTGLEIPPMYSQKQDTYR
jgi:hypothetical protein